MTEMTIYETIFYVCDMFNLKVYYIICQNTVKFDDSNNAKIFALYFA